MLGGKRDDKHGAGIRLRAGGKVQDWLAYFRRTEEYQFQEHKAPYTPEGMLRSNEKDQEHLAMNFEDWMRHRGLSNSSVNKYASAIEGPLSEWAGKHHLTEGPLSSLKNKDAFLKVSEKLQTLDIFKQRNSRGHHMYSSALAKYVEYLSEGYGSDLEQDIEEILADKNLSRTECLSLVKSRIGQGVFRQKLLLHWKACSVTGFKDTNLLIASHIKPWRSCSNSERLDPFNGLLLTPNLDRVFDAGLITFTDSGSIALSPLLSEPSKLGISLDMRVEISAPHRPFINFHREAVFRAT